jgi:hypothetical protein
MATINDLGWPHLLLALVLSVQNTKMFHVEHFLHLSTDRYVRDTLLGNFCEFFLCLKRGCIKHRNVPRGTFFTLIHRWKIIFRCSQKCLYRVLGALYIHRRSPFYKYCFGSVPIYQPVDKVKKCSTWNISEKFKMKYVAKLKCACKTET